MAKSSGESQEHLDLKRRALVWAQARGFNVCAVEVTVPRSGFRADVAACAVQTHSDVVGDAAVFECKQARSDLLRDAAGEDETMRQLKRLSARRAKLEETLGRHLPDLRRGETLFPECDSYDFESIRHDGLRKIRRDESILKHRLYGRTKFDRMTRYACADFLYLVVCQGIIRRHEAPEGWGILETGKDGLSLLRAPARLSPSKPARRALLHAVAVGAARAVNRQFAITREDVDQIRASVVDR